MKRGENFCLTFAYFVNKFYRIFYIFFVSFTCQFHPRRTQVFLCLKIKLAFSLAMESENIVEILSFLDFTAVESSSSASIPLD